MLVLKERIRRWNTNRADKLMVWAVCTIAFAGAFRIHELLCRLESTFDPEFELLRSRFARVATRNKFYT
jgi:hypothetical protein